MSPVMQPDRRQARLSHQTVPAVGEDLRVVLLAVLYGLVPQISPSSLCFQVRMLLTDGRWERDGNGRTGKPRE